MIELVRKLISYSILFFFIVFGLFSLGILKNDLVIGSIFIAVSIFGIWASIRSIRFKEMPGDIFVTANKKAKSFLVNPIEIKEYCKSANTDLFSIQKEIANGSKVAYEYRGYTFVENDI